jgi:hypothetical protein
MSRKVSPKIIEAVACIAPRDALPWLAQLLWEWLPSLAVDRGVHERQPSKVSMRKSLLQVSEAAALLRQALQNPPIREFLESEGR